MTATDSRSLKPTLRPRKGVTFVELLVYIILFAIFLGMVSAIFTWMKNSQGSVKRLDILHQLRASSFLISEQMSYASGIIFPACDPSGKGVNQLIFRSSANEVIALFINKKNQLVQINWTAYCTTKKGYQSCKSYGFNQ